MINEERYIRQINLPQVGLKGQKSLQDARVLVIGAGGLGCAVLPYLNAGGIGNLGIVDGDRVQESNLHRQILYTEADVGRYKAEVAAASLRRANPGTSIISYTTFFNVENAFKLIESYDLVVDATDEIATRYLINDACVLQDKILVHASIFRFEAQITVFNYKKGPTYRCLFPTPPTSTQSCAEAGVLGTTVGLAGLYQANEVFKIILDAGNILSGTLLMIDSLRNSQHRFSFTKKNTTVLTEQDFRELHRPTVQINYKEAKNRKGSIIDLREPEELPLLHSPLIRQIPLSRLEEKIDQLLKDQSIFLFCQSGKRSKIAHTLLSKKGFKEVLCLRENASEIKNILNE